MSSRINIQGMSWPWKRRCFYGLNKNKDFGELVGMLIAGFEAECIALLHRIDAERKKGRHTPVPRKPTRSAKQGTSELQNLISTVNYGGKKVASLRH